MAYGSLVVGSKSKVTTTNKSTTATKTNTNTKATSSKLSVIEPPPQLRRESLPSSLSDDEDPDFGLKAKEAVKKEVMEEEKAKEKGKGKGKSKPKDRVKVDEEDEKKNSKKKKTKILVSPDEDSDEQPPGRSSEGALVDAARKRFRLDSGSDADEPKPKRRSTGSYKRVGKQVDLITDTPDEIDKHLKSLWRSPWQKRNPEMMSKGRKRMEEKYNKLVGLLGVALEVINSDEEKGRSVRHIAETSEDSASDLSSDEDRKAKFKKPTASQLAYLNNEDQTDSDQEEEEKVRIFKKVASSSTATTSRVKILEIKPVKKEAEDDDEDYGPDIDTEDSDSDAPPLAPPAPVARPMIVDYDEEEEMDPLAKRMQIEIAERMKKAKEREKAKREKEEDQKKALRNEERKRKREEDKAAEDADEEEEEISILEKNRLLLLQPRVRYPIEVRKGRPKFKILNYEMDKLGAHPLAPGFEIPAPVNKFLRPYQREGVEFMFRQYMKKKGGLLGDDMGLGKTIQVIAFLSAIMRKSPEKEMNGVTGTRHDKDARRDAVGEYYVNGSAPPLPSSYGATCLIVCPASVIHNWKREFTTWSYLDVLIYEGVKESRGELMKRFRRGYYDVVIAGIEAVRANIEDLKREDFTIVIVDEAHRVKNPRSTTTKSLHLFPTLLRYGLTGTAIQNRLEEFWCILDWTCPGEVGRKNLWNLYISSPLKFAQKIDADDSTLAKGRTRALQLVTNLLPNFWLRRTKDTVKLQLPKKTDNVVLCPLTPLQKSVYKRILGLEDVQRILRYDQPCECGEEDPQGLPFQRRNCCDPFWYKDILKYITVFQKIANHLALIYPDKEDLADNEEKYNQDLEWARAAFPDDYTKRNRVAITSLDSSLCGKWTVLLGLLEHWHSQGDKVLIFSLSLRVLSLIKEKMQQTHFAWESLDGSVPQEQRMERVDRFNNDPECFCFLISTRAGGVGLNLIAANRVVIFDPNWNPSHDLQAMDRAYRMGQQRDVAVYRLIGAGTLEELIYNRQQYKRAQAQVGYEATAERRLYAGVEGEKDEKGELFGVRNIFRVQEHHSMTAGAIQACNVAELEFAKNAAVATDTLKPKKKKKKQNSGSESSDEELNAAIPVDVALKALVGIPVTKSAEEAARLKKAQDERDAIARIFSGSGVTVSVQSDATLGGSKAEEERARRAMRDLKAKRRSSPPLKKGRIAPEGPKVPDWNPLTRRVAKTTASDLKPPKIEVLSSDEDENDKAQIATSRRTILAVASSLGIRASVELPALITPGGYGGERGLSKLARKLEGLSRQEQEKKIKEILNAYLESKGVVKMEL